MTDIEFDAQLHDVLYPQSVAVVGASPDVTKFGGRLFRFLVRHGFAGRLFPINPRQSQIQGYPAYPSVLEVPEPIDVALLLVPVQQVLPMMRQCAERRVKGVVIMSTGFAESGPDGQEREETLRQIAREANMLVIGPNCLGLVNVHHHLALSSSISLDTDLIPGNVSIVSQSGALMGTLFGRAQDQGVGLSHAISCGNQTIVEVADFIRVLLDDPETAAIAAYVEGFKTPARFRDAADGALHKGKPLVLLKVGVTEQGARMAASHTASLAGSDLVVEALCRQKGIARITNPDQLYETTALFAKSPLPERRGMATLSPSGGLCGIIADKATLLGLELPTFSETTQHALATALGSWNPSNPFDFGSGTTLDPDAMLRCFDAIAADENVGIVYSVISDLPGMEFYIAGLIERWKLRPTKPWAIYWFAGSILHASYEACKRARLPLFSSLDDSLLAVKSLLRYGQVRRRYLEGGHVLSKQIVHPAGLRQVAERLKTETGALSEFEALDILAACGIPVVPHVAAASADEAVRGAQSLGYPVAVKVMSSDILHKARVGGVRLNLQSEADVRVAFGRVMDSARANRPGARLDGVLVQIQVPAGIEVIVGLKVDPQFGPLVLFGLGGLFVETLRDVSACLVPLSRDDAAEMLTELKSYGLLAAVFEQRPERRDELIDILLRVSALGEEFGERLAEVDINPLIIPTDEGHIQAVDALVIAMDPRGDKHGI